MNGKHAPLAKTFTVLPVLEVICRVAEGNVRVRSAAQLQSAHAHRSPHTIRAALGFAAVLRDVCWFSTLGAREGEPRSISSIIAASMLRFMSTYQRCIAEHHIGSDAADLNANAALAVTRDGTKLLRTNVADRTITVLSVADGAVLKVLGGPGTANPYMLFNQLRQVFVADDDFVFIADGAVDRVVVLTPKFKYHQQLGRGVLRHLYGVCATADYVFTSESHANCIAIINRATGRFMRQITMNDPVHTNVYESWRPNPTALCLLADRRHFIVAVQHRYLATVYTLDGKFVRHLGTAAPDDDAAAAEADSAPFGCFVHTGFLYTCTRPKPVSIACSPYDEIIVTTQRVRKSSAGAAAADTQRTENENEKDINAECGLVLLNAHNTTQRVLLRGVTYSGVAIRGDSVFAHCVVDCASQCIVFV
jgi:hypothetical protein